MTREEVHAQIEKIGIVPAIRVGSAADALFAAEAVAANGIPIVEVTMTVPGAFQVISELARHSPSITVGAGSILDVETARHCAEAGASFLTSTGLDLDVVRVALEQQIVVFPGALTPTEIMSAWKARPDFVKIFPCAQAGGPAYIRALRAPFPQVPFIASGGVNQQTIAEFILAGARAVGIGSELIPHQAIERREPRWIGELARRFLTMVKDARAQSCAGLAPVARAKANNKS